jgi:hypothetical protein
MPKHLGNPVFSEDMKTYDEIDREQEADIREANKALSLLSGKGGLWWSYSVSLSRFELLVGEATGKDNLVLSLAACEYISGPVLWDEQNLEVIWHNDRTRESGSWKFILQDEPVGFKAIGKLFSWRKDFDLQNLTTASTIAHESNFR